MTPGAGFGPPEAATATSLRAISSATSQSPGPITSTRSRSRREILSEEASEPSAVQTEARQSSLGREPPKRPQEEAQGAALLLEAEGDPQRSITRRPAGRSRPRAGPGHSCRGSSARAAPPVTSEVTVRTSRRPKKISTSGLAMWVESRRSCAVVEGGDVEREGVPQGARRDARPEGLVDVDDVEGHGAEQRLERPTSVDRHRRGAGTGTARQRHPATDREHPRLALGRTASRAARGRRRSPSARRAPPPATPRARRPAPGARGSPARRRGARRTR